MVTAETSRRLLNVFIKSFGRFVLRSPLDPSDCLVTLADDIEHDTTDRLSELGVPTMIVAGDEHPFFPEALLRETAETIPGAELRVHRGVGA